MARKSIHDVLKEISHVKKKQERVDLIRSAVSQMPTVFGVIKLAYDPTFEFMLPEGETPYKANDIPNQEAVLYGKVRTFYMYVKNTETGEALCDIPQIKREKLWIDLLEAVTKEDAQLLDHIKDNRSLPWKTLNRTFIDAAFPGQIPVAPKKSSSKKGDPEDAKK